MRMSQLYRCTKSLFSESNSTLTECIFDTDILESFINFNETVCIDNVKALSKNLDYTCTYFFSYVYNTTDCYQFYFIPPNVFQSHSCPSFNEHLAVLFEINNDIIEVVFSIFFLFLLIFHDGGFMEKYCFKAVGSC